MPRQTSIQLTEASERQVEELKAKGFGSMTDVIRTAVDRMWRDECAPLQRNVNELQIWQHCTAGERYAVMTEGGICVNACGPLAMSDFEAVQAGETDLDWNGELSDDIAEHVDEYRVIWPWVSA